MAFEDLLTNLPLARQVLGEQGALENITTIPSVAPTPQPAQSRLLQAIQGYGQSPQEEPENASEEPTAPGTGVLDRLKAKLEQRLGSLAFAPETQMPNQPGATLSPFLGMPSATPISPTGTPITTFPGAPSVPGIPGTPGTPSPSTGPIPSTPSGGVYELLGDYGKLIEPKGAVEGLEMQRLAARSLYDSGIDVGQIQRGSYRTPEQQAAYYASDPKRYAAPGSSYHEVGLGIDVNAPYRDTPEFQNKVHPWLLANGWYQERPDEPWHYSFRPTPQEVAALRPQQTEPARTRPSSPPARRPAIDPRQR